MLPSEMIYILHWIIYIVSFAAFGALFTKYYKLGALWISVLFLVQTVWGGCPIVTIQNYFRVHEGMLPLENGLLTASLSSNPYVQYVLSALTAIAALALVLIKKEEDDKVS